MTDKQEHSQDTQPEKPLIDIKTGNQTVDQSIVRVSRFAAWFQAIPAVAHFIRALERFNDRLGSQFGAAITYFSFLSLIPILMVSFAAVGFVLASNPDLLTDMRQNSRDLAAAFDIRKTAADYLTVFEEVLKKS